VAVPVRAAIHAEGVVQGVGFRPWVCRKAGELGLAGWVRNGPEGVQVEVEGDPGDVDTFVALVRGGGPPAASVRSVTRTDMAVAGGRGFAVVGSDAAPARPGAPVLSPDLVVCASCLAETQDPADRRFDYAFTSCTDCGPRYTITRGLPYDRHLTTMAPFVLCTRCAHEYRDTTHRRFHAETTGCPDCGPSTTFAGLSGRAAIAAAGEVLRRGGVVAVKGLGGYQIVADACSSSAVRRTRQMKARPDRPLAVMVADLDAAALVCDLSGAARAELASPSGPVVLAARRDPSPLAPEIAPGVSTIGVMLPTTPLHHMLASEVPGPLVATSGNRSGDPIARDPAEFGRMLARVDGVLDHDRAVHVRCDDSVVSVNGARRQVLRRARGFVPRPVRLPVAAAEPVLALGGQLKVTVAVAVGCDAVASHHLGDAGAPAALAGIEEAVAHLCSLCRVDPVVVACDMHPDYVTTRMASASGLHTVAVQHHHAHAAACLAEHGESGPVLAVAFDGHGWGPDETLWGGEFLVADLHGFQRVGRIRPVALPGGEAAVVQPWRMALSWLDAADRALAREWSAQRQDAEAILHLCAHDSTMATSSAGRVFDAAAALCGVAPETATFEGQAAMALEAAASKATRLESLAPATITAGRDGLVEIDPAPLLASLAAAKRAGAEVAPLAAAFTASVAQATGEAAERCAEAAGLDTVVLTGGVMQNLAFEAQVRENVRSAGLRVLVHEDVPANDGGISIGQAAVAAARLSGGGEHLLGIESTD